MRISIVIPCLNAEDLLGQTIESALAQRRPPSEILIVDDGSTDRSRQVAGAFGAPVRVVVRDRAGASAARNCGASLTTGEALMFLDADDRLGPDALDALAEVLAECDDGVAVCPWYRLERVRGQWVVRPPSCRPRRAGLDPLCAWLEGWYHPPCSVLWSRAAFERTGGWDERIGVNDDGDLMMRALAGGTTFLETGRGAAFYRRQPNSLSGTRRTPDGLRSRFSVIEALEHALGARADRSIYARSLSVAYAALAADCGPDSRDIRSNCRDRIRRLGGRRAAANETMRILASRTVRQARALCPRLPVTFSGTKEEEQSLPESGRR